MPKDEDRLKRQSVPATGFVGGVSAAPLPGRCPERMLMHRRCIGGQGTASRLTSSRVAIGPRRARIPSPYAPHFFEAAVKDISAPVVNGNNEHVFQWQCLEQAAPPRGLRGRVFGARAGTSAQPLRCLKEQNERRRPRKGSRRSQLSRCGSAGGAFLQARRASRHASMTRPWSR